MDDNADEEHDDQRVEAEGDPLAVVVVDIVHGDIAHGSEQHIVEDALHGIVDRVLTLSDDIAQHHCRAIASHAGPCTSHVAIDGDEDDVHGKQHGTACQ